MVFPDASQMKESLREQMVKPQYCVTNFYWKTGFTQFIARHPRFENVTLAVIFLNAVWIAIDTDLNPGEVLTDSPPAFQVVEQCFCSYFSFEMIRFCAFQRKCNCVRDPWFVF